MSAVREREPWGRGLAAPAVRSSGRGRRPRLRRWRDWSVVAAILAAAAALWVPYAIRAQFLYDDWWGVSDAAFGRAGISWQRLAGYRPGGLVLSLLGLDGVLGTDPRRRYLFLCACAGVAAVMLYVTLRQFHAHRAAAGLAALLLLAFPRADSLHLWSGTAGTDLATAITLGGTCAGLRWAESAGRAWTWLPLCALMTAWGVSMYEPIAALALMPVALVALAWQRRRVLLVALCQLAAGLGILLEERVRVGPSTDGTFRPAQDYPSRALALMASGWQNVISRLFAETGSAALVAAALAGAAGAAAVVVLRRRRAGRESAPLNRVATGIAGTTALLVGAALLSWLVFVPANPWYDPVRVGVGDRVNAVAAVFLSSALALLAGGVTALPVRATALRAVSCGAGLALAALTTITFVGAARDHARVYQDASARRDHLLAVLRAGLPQPGSNDVILLGDVNMFDGPLWVPVFAAQYDINGAVQLAYGNPSLRGELVDGSQRCLGDGVLIDSRRVPFTAVHVLEGDADQVASPTDRASCMASLTRPARIAVYPFA